MDLLFKREQKRGWFRRRIAFKLWAKAELTEEERKLITRYRMDDAMLIEAPTPGLMRNAFIVGAISFPVAYLLMIYLSNVRAFGTYLLNLVCRISGSS